MGGGSQQSFDPKQQFGQQPFELGGVMPPQSGGPQLGGVIPPQGGGIDISQAFQQMFGPHGGGPYGGGGGGYGNTYLS